MNIVFANICFTLALIFFIGGFVLASIKDNKRIVRAATCLTVLFIVIGFCIM